MKRRRKRYTASLRRSQTWTTRAYIRKAIELAREAVADGDRPFGSLLAVDDDVVRTAKNSTVTEGDITAHPELKLARWAARKLSAEERAECTMYASAEPCPMCGGAIQYAGLGRVVYSVSNEALAEVRDDDHIGIPCSEVIKRRGGVTVVNGPVLEAKGVAVYEEFY